MLFSLRNLSRTYASVIHNTIIAAVNETCKEVTNKVLVGTHFPADKSLAPISPRLRSHCDDLFM